MALFAGLLAGCATDEFAGKSAVNEPPTVWLSGKPPEGSIAKYRIHLFWGGWDPDGEIAYYEYVITNNETGVFDPADTTGAEKWHTVVGNDSVFQFTADVFMDSADVDWRDHKLGPYEFRRSHTFFIRSVDDLGRRSERPAYISFTSRTLSPTIQILIPRRYAFTPTRVPPITTFQWKATDFINTEAEIQDPDSVRWILVPVPPSKTYPEVIDYVRRTPDAPEWYPWAWYRAPGDSGKFWTSLPPQDPGNYVFAVQAKDEAGAVTPVFDEMWNVRRIRVVTETPGPQLTVVNRYIGTIVVQGTRTPPTIIDLPANVAMSFEWEATSETYGGLVSGYRYGWDILDLNDDSQWDISFTPFVGTRAPSPPRKFSFGTHQFYVEVIDNSGFKSRVGVTLNILPFTMERDLLLIDDWIEDSAGWDQTSGGLPSDAQHDAFWVDLLRDVEDFNPATDILELNVGGVNTVPLTRFAPYRAVIWNSVGSEATTAAAGLSPVIRWIDPRAETPSGRQQPNIAALYLAAGGKLLLVGDRIMTMVINRDAVTPRFPFIFRYELGGDQDGTYDDQEVGEHGIGEDSFAYSECCLNVLDIASINNPGAVRKKTPNQRCFVHLLRDHNARTNGLRECLPLDTLSFGGFPKMTLRSIVAGDVSRYYHESKTSLNCDLYNPPYFAEKTPCEGVAEYGRECFQPIWGLGCLDQSSNIFEAPIAFWTTVNAGRVPDAGGVPARSAIWGFQPVFFEPTQVKEALDILLFGEWQLKRGVPESSAAAP